MASSVDAAEPKHVDTAEPNRPVIAHKQSGTDPYRALCGTPLNGTKAPRDAERCVVCLDLLGADR
jgi:hypothetical protein